MNTITWNSWVSCTVFLAIFFTSTLAFAAGPIEVKLKVSGSELIVDGEGNNSPCGKDKKSPCIEVARGRTPYIKFMLAHACVSGDNKNYKLTGVKITLIENVWPTKASPLNELVAKDFNADASTGEIDLKPKDDLLKFKNLNSNGYTVFYEVSAEPCVDDSGYDNIYLDPEIRNRGKS